MLPLCPGRGPESRPRGTHRVSRCEALLLPSCLALTSALQSPPSVAEAGCPASPPDAKSQRLLSHPGSCRRGPGLRLGVPLQSLGAAVPYLCRSELLLRVTGQSLRRLDVGRPPPAHTDARAAARSGQVAGAGADLSLRVPEW